MRGAVDDDGEHEKNQAKFDQRAEVDIAGGLGELVGDHRCDGVAGRKAAKRGWRESLPITMVTAMVSPRARARARKIDPIMPSRAKGTTTCQVDSHLVAPSASAASRWSRGTASNASREMEMMNGKVMMARIEAGGKITDAVGRALEQGQKAESLFQKRLDVLPHQRDQSEDREQAEDHAGDRGQQLDEECTGVREFGRGQFREEDRGAHAQRDGDHSARNDVTTVP